MSRSASEPQTISGSPHPERPLGPSPKALEALYEWYRREARDLPWRRTNDPYPVMVSETMLQQTTVGAVIPAFKRWMARFPTLEALAEASLDEVLSCWSGLGYYQRARRLKSAAEEIRDRGSFPETREQLLGLSGVGPYTAAAIASIAFCEPVLSIDTNVARVLLRYRGEAVPATSQRTHRSLQAELEPTYSRLQAQGLEAGQLNQALMELGATVCRATSALCGKCPWSLGCRARQTDRVMEIPKRNAPTPPKLTLGRIHWIERDQRLLLVRGTSLGLLSSLFQPPISFQGADRDQPVERFLARLEASAPPSATVSTEPFDYRISGRLLRLESTYTRLEPMEHPLEAGSLETVWLTAQEILGGRGCALSSLTRRAFTESLENRASDRRSGAR